MSRKKSEGYENQTQKPEWRPVAAPEPLFSSAEEARAQREAVASTPRLPGEDVCSWLERVNAKAREVQAPRMPYREPDEREPGVEG